MVHISISDYFISSLVVKVVYFSDSYVLSFVDVDLFLVLSFSSLQLDDRTVQ